MTDIPQARNLLDMALEMNTPGAKDKFIQAALMLMTRKIKKRPAAIEAAKMTSEKVVEIQQLLQLYPDASYVRLGRMAGVNGGRVCDVFLGHRTPEHPGMIHDGLSEEIREVMNDDHRS